MAKNDDLRQWVIRREDQYHICKNCQEQIYNQTHFIECRKYKYVVMYFKLETIRILNPAEFPAILRDRNNYFMNILGIMRQYHNLMILLTTKEEKEEWSAVVGGLTALWISFIKNEVLIMNKNN